MIPALLAAPLVEGVLGQVLDALVPHSSALTPPPFQAELQQASGRSNSSATVATASSGTMTAGQWTQMGSVEKTEWLQGLKGSHVNATDASGKTFSGVVEGLQKIGTGGMAVNIGGHLVSLAQLKQITWSPATITA